MLPTILRLDRIKLLPPRLRIVANKATKPERTLQDISDVVAAVQNATAAHKLCFLPVAFDILASGPGPPSADDFAELSQRDWASRVYPLLMAHDAIMILVNGGALGSASQSTLTSDFFAAVWGNIWPWTQFIVDCYDHIHVKEAESSSKERRFVDFMHFHWKFIERPETRRLLFSTPGFCAVTAEFWTILKLDDGRIAEADEEEMKTAELLLWRHFLRSDVSLGPLHIAEIVDGVGGTLTDLARVLTSHMEVLAQVGIVDPFHMVDILAFIKLVDETTDSTDAHSIPGPLARAVWRLGIIHHMNEIAKVAILSWASQGPEFATSLEVVTALRACLRFFNRGILAAQSDAVARHPVLAPDLMYIATCCIIRLSGEAELMDLVGLGAEIVLPAAFVDFHRAENVADGLFALRERLPSISPRTLALERWGLLVDQVTSREELAKSLQDAVVMFACDNLECGTIDAVTKFKECSGCKDAYYCSRRCQSEDWTQGGHRTVCEQARSLGLTSRHGHRRRSYLRALVQDEYQIHKREVYAKQLALMREQPELDPARIVTVFDLSTISTTISVEIFHPEMMSASPADEWAARAWSRALVRAKTGNGYHLHVVKPPAGLKRRAAGWHAWPPAILARRPELDIAGVVEEVLEANKDCV
ncbi:MYND-type domain-containing protein [Mycena kentingensis (nom. inval.)]|nr:MYND-type domain-containing protein [Mycena kentingensis (nom. inval.)]